MNQNSVCRRTVTVNQENGLHLVPCSLIAQTAGRHECDVRITKGELSVDAKDIFDLLSLSADCGTVLVLDASGTGAAQAIDELVQLFESGFSGDPVANGDASPS